MSSTGQLSLGSNPCGKATTPFRAITPGMPARLASALAAMFAGILSSTMRGGSDVLEDWAQTDTTVSSKTQSLAMTSFSESCRKTQRTLRVSLAPFKFGALKNVAHYCLLALLWLALAGCGDKRGENTSGYVQRPRGAITYSKDIAPIIFNNCSGCHRPGESAPFNLLTYDDARKHAKQIVDVTQRRYMPPWLPDPTQVHFVGERRLNDEQLGLIKQWAA